MSEITEKELGSRIQTARQKAGLTQQQLCDQAGLSYSTLAKIERGAIKTPSVFTIASISKLVGVPVEDLIGANQKGGRAMGKNRSKTGIEFVYFDVNGVMVRFFHRAFVEMAKDTNMAPDLIESTFWHYNDEVCRGDMSLKNFNKILAKTLGVPSVKWEDYYFKSVERIEEMQKLVVWAEKHYQIGLLTNVMPGFLSRMIKEGKLPKVPYDQIIDSSVEKTVKPEPKIFKIASERAGVKPENILLIDDARANLMSAERAGWRVLWFDDYHPAEGAERVRQMLEF